MTGGTNYEKSNVAQYSHVPPHNHAITADIPDSISIPRPFTT